MDAPAPGAQPLPRPSGRARLRARRRRRNRIRAGLAAAVLVVLVAGGIALASGSGGGSSPKAALLPGSQTLPTTAATTAPPTTTTTAPAPAVIATTKGAPIAVYTAAGGSQLVTTLSARTDYGLPRTLLVTDRQPGWLHVLLPIRPNDSSGWIRETDVTLGTTSYSIKVDLAAHQLTVLDGDQVVVQSQTVIGTSATPTPRGTFYVTDPVDLRSHPNGAYGAFALGLSGYSEVLMHFNGGPGQIAIHGTTATDLLGQDRSNGCVRVPNDVIVRIAQTVPLGTPVTIS
ncbi:MAG TPA: L,D-transpeptidase [Acidimicrobiia bacterium]|nr:L,D-transpeptidase [Acidimicrobiia bacterium]